MAPSVFDRLADRYDAWFDSERGAAIFEPEVQCLERLMPADRSGWVEVGVGSGRFARALGVPEGVDPSRPPLEMAAARGIRTVEGVAEDLPYPDGSLDGILLVVVLCFLADPDAAMGEFARVLRPGGRLLVGFVAADTPWGREYARKGKKGHPFYSVARFYTACEVTDMAARSGFAPAAAASALGKAPHGVQQLTSVADGALPEWGFVAMNFCLSTTRSGS